MGSNTKQSIVAIAQRQSIRKKIVGVSKIKTLVSVLVVLHSKFQFSFVFSAPTAPGSSAPPPPPPTSVPGPPGPPPPPSTAPAPPPPAPSSAPPPSSSGRGALLSSITGFQKGGLKKTVTVDKSAPKL